MPGGEGDYQLVDNLLINMCGRCSVSHPKTAIPCGWSRPHPRTRPMVAGQGGRVENAVLRRPSRMGSEGRWFADSRARHRRNPRVTCAGRVGARLTEGRLSEVDALSARH